MKSLARIKGILSLTDFEVVKMTRQKRAYVGVVVILMLTCLCAVGFYMRKSGVGHHSKDQFQGRLINDFINGIAFADTVLLPGIYILLPMVVGIFAAGSFAGELEDGRIRTIALRPVSRWSILASKFISLSFYSYVLLAALLAVSYTVGSIMFGATGDVFIFGPIFLGRSGDLFIMKGEVAIERMLLSYFFAGYSLISLCAMFLMCSAIFKRTVTASVVTLGIYYTSYILDALPFMENLQRFLPTRYLMVWKYVMAKQIMWESIMHDGTFLGIYTLCYLLIAGILFSNSDL